MCKFHHAGDVARDLRNAQSSNRRRLDEATLTRQMTPILGTTGISGPAMSAMVEIARRVWSSPWTLLVFASLFLGRQHRHRPRRCLAVLEVGLAHPVPPLGDIAATIRDRCRVFQHYDLYRAAVYHRSECADFFSQ
jgi:hypothetical protein